MSLKSEIEREGVRWLFLGALGFVAYRYFLKSRVATTLEQAEELATGVKSALTPNPWPSARVNYELILAGYIPGSYISPAQQRLLAQAQLEKKRAERGGLS